MEYTLPPVGSSLLGRIKHWSIICPQSPALSDTATGTTWSYEQLWQEIHSSSLFLSHLYSDGLDGTGEEQEEIRRNFLLLSDDTPEAYITALSVIAAGDVVAIVSADSPLLSIEKCRRSIEAAAVLIPDSLSYTPEEETPSFHFSELRGEEKYEITQEKEESTEKTAVMLFTSGTTGDPKAVMLPQRSFYAIADHNSRLSSYLE